MARYSNQRKKSLMFCFVCIMLFIFGVTAGISYAYFTDHKEVSNTLNFGKLIISTNENNVVDLTLTGDPVDTETKRLGVSDKVTIAGSIGLEENSVPAYIRMKMKVYEKGTTTEIKSTFNEAFMAEMAKVVYKDSNNVEMQWFVVGKYLYLGNKIEAGKPFVYSNANIYAGGTETGKNEITLTEAMVPNELQGKDVDVKFTLQAIQSAGMNLTLSNYTQENATSISQLAVWQDIFGADLNEIYSNEYATGYVRGILSDTEYKAGAQVSNQMTKSPYNYFTKSANNTGDYVAFGFFPQTIKDSKVVVKEDWKETFNGIEYYLGSDGYLYEKVSENAYNSDYKYSDENTTINQASANSYKYFKLEPIIWQIMKENDTVGRQAYLISVAELTAQKFDDRSKAYDSSAIKTFLEGTFKSKAFTNSQSDKIKPTNLTTSEYSSSSDTAKDKTSYDKNDNGYSVFLPSFGDMKSYGYTTNANRIKWPTDYAGANNAYRSSTANNGGYWWSRSARSSDSNVWSVNNDGYLTYDYPTLSINGVVPALFLSI